MNFFANIFQKRELTQQAPADVKSAQPTGGGDFYGNEVRIDGLKGSLSVAAFYRGVELRANTMSMLVMEYQKRNDKAHGDHYEQYMRGEGRHINYLLQVQPNPTMTWRQLCKNAEIMRIEGNAYIYVDRFDTGEIRALWLCSDGFYDPMNNSYSISYNNGRKLVTLVNVPHYEVIHLRNTFSNDNGLTGLSTIRFARETVSTAATNDQLVKDTAAKGGRIKLLLQEEKQTNLLMGRANKKELEKITNQLNSDVYSKDVVMVSNVANVTPISQTLTEQSIDTIRKFSVLEIARFLGVPPVMLMETSNTTYKTPETATQEFILRTIAPLASDWEQELTAKLVGEAGWPVFRYHFNDQSLLRLDPLGRAKLDEIHLSTGVKCVNELRQGYDLPAVEKGDTHYVSTNLAELGSEKLSKVSGQSSSPTASKDGNEGKEEGDGV